VPITEATAVARQPVRLDDVLHGTDLESCDGLRPEVRRVAVFQPAGATGRCGEVLDPETHLIPTSLAAACGRLPHVEVYGNDYRRRTAPPYAISSTIVDLGSAHILALDSWRRAMRSNFFNLGTGRGNSVLEVIQAARRVSGRESKWNFARAAPAIHRTWWREQTRHARARLETCVR
jgi:UDP-glucose 4-epimerase